MLGYFNMPDVSEINGLDQANNLPDTDELAPYLDLLEELGL